MKKSHLSMLDNKTVQVIAQFKQALSNKALPVTANSHILTSNRGSKLEEQEENEDALKSKVVEYNGVHYLVSSNKKLDKIGKSNKRKWKDFYKSTEEYKQAPESSEDESAASDASDSQSDTESNPLEGLDITEILLSIGHPSELVSHPAILRTYKLEVLSKLALELIDTIESEQQTLNWFNKLLQVLNGEDWYYLLEDNLGLLKYDHGLVNDDEEEDKKPEESSEDKNQDVKKEDPDIPKRITRTSNSEADEVTDPFFQLPETLKKYEQHQARIVEEPQEGKENELKNVQEDLINYLQVSIQRQQEHIKNLQELRNNIVRADRLKSNLLKWGKEMYDKRSN